MAPLIKSYLLFVVAFALAASLAVAAQAQSSQDSAPRATKGGIGLSITLPFGKKDRRPRAGGKITIGTTLPHGAGRPDLVIVPRFAGNTGQPGTGFCGNWVNGQNHVMVFYVRNQGAQTVPGTQVQIAFNGQSFVKNVGALPPNTQRVVTQTIPPNAWQGTSHPRANFQVTADPLSNLPESNEGNNSAINRCNGPAV